MQQQQQQQQFEWVIFVLRQRRTVQKGTPLTNTTTSLNITAHVHMNDVALGWFCLVWFGSLKNINFSPSSVLSERIKTPPPACAEPPRSGQVLLCIGILCTYVIYMHMIRFFVRVRQYSLVLLDSCPPSIHASSLLALFHSPVATPKGACLSSVLHN